MKNKHIVSAQEASLRETIAHFKSTNRGLTRGQCQYRPDPEGHHCGCAIGRHIPNKELCAWLDAWLDDDGGPGTGFGTADSARVFSRLPGQLQALGADFLGAVQSLHDCGGYWAKDGLSLKGEEQLYTLALHHGLNPEALLDAKALRRIRGDRPALDTLATHAII